MSKQKNDGVNSQGAGDGKTSGESGGGAYPNPHDASGDDRDPPGAGLMGHGGQSEIGYHGPGQLGGEKADKARKGRVGQGG